MFVDKVESGTGLISFAAMMKGLAIEQGVLPEFQKAAHCHTYVRLPTFDPHHIIIGAGHRFPMSFTGLNICPGSPEGYRIGNMTTDYRRSRKSSRHQPICRIEFGGHKVKPIRNVNRRSEIQTAIENAVHSLTSKSATPRPPEIERLEVNYTPET